MASGYQGLPSTHRPLLHQTSRISLPYPKKSPLRRCYYDCIPTYTYTLYLATLVTEYLIPLPANAPHLRKPPPPPRLSLPPIIAEPCCDVLLVYASTDLCLPTRLQKSLSSRARKVERSHQSLRNIPPSPTAYHERARRVSRQVSRSRPDLQPQQNRTRPGRRLASLSVCHLPLAHLPAPRLNSRRRYLVISAACQSALSTTWTKAGTWVARRPTTPATS